MNKLQELRDLKLQSGLKHAGIYSIAIELPPKAITNFDLEKTLDTTDEWITSRTGIKERRVVEGQTVSDLGALAGLKAVKAANLDVSDIDLLVLATTSPEMVFPSTSTVIHKKMGLKNCPAFDVMAACSGFTYGIEIAANFIRTGSARNVLFVAAETMSKLVDWNDRGTCILFGDGAAAVVLKETEAGFGLLSTYLAADGNGNDLLKVPGGGADSGICSADPKDNYIQMNGNEVFKFAVRAIPDACKNALNKANLSIEAIDYFIPHQANKRIIDSAAQKLGIDESKVVINIENYGNTSSASIPLAIYELYEAGKLKWGDMILTAGVGGGFTWGANIIRWNI